MNIQDVRVLGGIVSGKIKREKYLNEYYKNPNKCRFCNKTIEVRDGEKIQRARRRKFCNSSCSASFNNKIPKKKAVKEGICERCGCEIVYRKTDRGYIRVRYCDGCREIAKAESRGGEHISKLTKGKLRERYKNYTGFRGTISRHARDVYIKSGSEMKCKICGYDKWVDICHNKPVADFSNDELIVVINDISNLTAYCKNHHWEFDNLDNIGGFGLKASDQNAPEREGWGRIKVSSSITQILCQ